MKRLSYCFIFTLLFCKSIAISVAASPESCAFCPAAYCENIPLAKKLKEERKREAERKGLPKRLSILFDRLGDCQACVEFAPTWPHLVVEYDGEKMSALHQREIKDYNTSYPWSASGEYQARQKMMAGLVKQFHVTLGSKPCHCCKATNEDEYRSWQKLDQFSVLLDDPKWNDRLSLYDETTLSTTTVVSAEKIPEDLDQIAPINRVREPIPGTLADFNTASVVRNRTALCLKCQPNAEEHNALAKKSNTLNRQIASLKRDQAYERAMADYSRDSINGLNQVASTMKARQQLRGHQARMDKAYEELERLNTEIEKIVAELTKKRAELDQTITQLIECEAQQCQQEVSTRDQVNEPFKLFGLGSLDFAHTNNQSVCPNNDAGSLILESNNGNALHVDELGLNSRIEDALSYEVIHNDTSSPIIKGIYNCESKRTGKQKTRLNAKVTDVATGESISIRVEGKGQIHKKSDSTGDPNHIGYKGEPFFHKKVTWEPIASQCKQCAKLVEQFNATMSKLLFKRYQLASFKAHKQSPEKSTITWNMSGESSNGMKLDPTRLAQMKDLGNFIKIMEIYESAAQSISNHILELEQQVSYLRSVILECEKQRCAKGKKTKITDIRIGNERIKTGYQPDFKLIMQDNNIDWTGAYSTNCLPCQPIVLQLNAVPAWLTRASFKVRNAQMELDLVKLTKSIAFSRKDLFAIAQGKLNKATAELQALVQYHDKLRQDLVICSKKYCAADSSKTANFLPGTHLSIDRYQTCHASHGDEPIEIGSNNEVGSSANFKEKAKQKLTGAAGKAITGLLGVGGDSGGKSSDPIMYKDPVKKKYKTKVKSKNPKRELKTGAVFTKDGLLVSNDITKFSGKGTFHTMYLQNQAGWQLFPINYFLYQIWKDWKLNVSWTKDTYVDGEHVSHEEGGWSEEWSEMLYEEGIEYREGSEEASPMRQQGMNKYAPIIWSRLGFNTAVSGARSLGTLFPVSPAMLAQEPLELFVHLSDPKTDPVVSIPYVFKLSLDDDGSVITEHQQRSSYTRPCPEPLVIAPIGSTIKGSGVREQNDDYYFQPSNVDDDLDKVIIEYKLNDQTGGTRVVPTPTPVVAVETGTEEQEANHTLEEQVEELEDFDEELDPDKDSDGDGIADSVDTKPYEFSNEFFQKEGSMVGRIIDRAGHKVQIKDNGDGGVSVLVDDNGSDKPAVVELLGIELELDPGTWIDGSFG